MITQQSQIKLNLPLELKDFLASKAQKFGMPMASYIRHLILKDVEDMQYPEHQASKRVEQAYAKAIEDYRQGKTMVIKDRKALDAFFANL